MTVIIDLSPDEQAWLTSTARQAGTEPAVLAKQFVTSQMPPHWGSGLAEKETPEAREQKRREAIFAAQGSFASLGASVDDLHRERQKDKQKEEAEANQ